MLAQRSRFPEAEQPLCDDLRNLISSETFHSPDEKWYVGYPTLAAGHG